MTRVETIIANESKEFHTGDILIHSAEGVVVMCCHPISKHDVLFTGVYLSGGSSLRVAGQVFDKWITANFDLAPAGTTITIKVV